MAGCRAEWGACPDHGNTLRSSGGRSWCRVDGRVWEGDRPGQHCAEPALFRVIDLKGGDCELCAGHTIAAREELIGCRVETL
jgi:hypothetical protein